MSWDRMCMKKSEGGLGFRKLHYFNLALLGKQAWRLVMKPDSVVSKIYRARYYPGGNFLSAKLGANPSFIWRSVIASQELLKEGLGCRVGSGENINILHEPWLPCDRDPYIRTENEALKGNKVSSLMSTDQESWDMDLIHDIFNTRDANLILSIPVRRTDADTWFWRNDKMGVYTVKSAYALIRDSPRSDQDSNNSKFWNKIWNLKIPLKVKHFLWKSIRGCLPTKDCLRQKKVTLDSMCPVCNLVEETTTHVLVTCPIAMMCWQNLGYTPTLNEDLNMQSWAEEVLQHSRRNVTNKIFMLAWSIWKNRNEIVWKQKGKDYEEIVKSGVQVLNNWESAQDKSFDPSIGFLTQSDGDVHWRQPQQGAVKVNIDAAIFTESSYYSYAMVARDHTGTLVAAQSSCKQGVLNPDLAETIGIREALSWVKSKDWQLVDVETDCIGAVQAIRCSSINFSYLGRVVDDCRRLIADLRLRNVTLKFVRRSANKVAHFLARYSSSLADRTWDMGNAHPEFIHVLANDLI